MNELLKITVNENDSVVVIDPVGNNSRFEKIFIEFIDKDLHITLAGFNGTNHIIKVPIWDV